MPSSMAPWQGHCCQCHCCCGVGAGYHPLIHPLPTANTQNQSPFPPYLTGFLLRPRGHFLCSNPLWTSTVYELEHSLHLWNSGSQICIQDANDEGSFVHEHLKTPDCSSLSLSVILPVPWPSVLCPTFFLYTEQHIATESCPLLCTEACDFGWEGSAHLQPKHQMRYFWCPESCSPDT